MYFPCICFLFRHTHFKLFSNNLWHNGRNRLSNFLISFWFKVKTLSMLKFGFPSSCKSSSLLYKISTAPTAPLFSFKGLLSFCLKDRTLRHCSAFLASFQSFLHPKLHTSKPHCCWSPRQRSRVQDGAGHRLPGGAE
jgi:hypothetical protein